jgi:3-oxoacid CoA-transferase subunit B
MTWTTRDMCREALGFIRPRTSVNLGIGLPTHIAALIPSEWGVMIHSENGVLGVSGRPQTEKEASPTLINAGKETVSIHPYASFFDSALSFGMIRGGHIDLCVLGGMQVDASGNLANWWAPGQKLTGMGGAMDLVSGAKEVMVLMKHFEKNGTSKLFQSQMCSYPLTGAGVVDIIVTDQGVFRCDREQKRFITLKLATPDVDLSTLFS